MTIAQRLDGRLDDEILRVEIGLADAEIDDVAALRHELHGPRQHGECILLADPIEGCDGLQHSVPPPHPSLPRPRGGLEWGRAVQQNRLSNANATAPGAKQEPRTIKCPGLCTF